MNKSLSGWSCTFSVCVWSVLSVPEILFKSGCEKCYSIFPKMFWEFKTLLLANSPLNHSVCPLWHTEGFWASGSPVLRPLSCLLGLCVCLCTELIIVPPWAVPLLRSSPDLSSSRSIVDSPTAWNQLHFVKTCEDCDSVESWWGAENLMVLNLSISMCIFTYLAL